MIKPIIKEYEKPFTLYEESQTSKIRYAFISAPKDGSAQCHPFVKCRDFLHDAVRTYLTKTKCEIYGFKYDSAIDPPIDLLRMRMHIKYKSGNTEEFIPIMAKAIKMINHYEEKMHSKTKTSATRLDDGSYVVRGPSLWLKSPILTTLFTLLFRLAEHVEDFTQGSTESITKAYKNAIDKCGGNLHANKDIKYLTSIYDKLPLITEKYKDLCSLHKNPYDPVMLEENSINSYHNYAGVVSLCKGCFVDKNRAELLKVLEEDYKEHKDLIRVKSYRELSPYVSYQPNILGIAFVNIIDEVRTQCTDFTECREVLTGYFRNRHAEADHLTDELGIPKAPSNVDDEKLRLLVRIPGVRENPMRMSVHKKEMFFAKRVLNYYEKTFDMQKSVIATVLLEHSNGSQYAWLFTSSQEWLISPVMLSMYVTILRSAKTFMYNHGLNPKGFPLPENMDNDTIKAMWETLYKKARFAKPSDADIHKEAHKFNTVLANRQLLFGNTSIKENHFIGKTNTIKNMPVHSYFSRVGIGALISHRHIDKNLINKFKELEK